MAGSRLERLGSVFTRVRNLMRAGVIKPEDKPLWYDVYEAFPPKREPLYMKTHPRVFGQKPDPVPEIFYEEDKVRAMFYKQYGQGPGILDLSKANFVSSCEKFVLKFYELKEGSDLSDAALFEETGKALLKEGLVLKRRGPSAPDEPAASAPDLITASELMLGDDSASEQNQPEPEPPATTQP